MVHGQDRQIGLSALPQREGKVSAYPIPGMSGVRWSQAQQDQRQRGRRRPGPTSIYVQMAVEIGKNPKRPFDMAVSDYCDTGNDLLWKKHMDDHKKPKNWDIERYSWYLTKRTPPCLRKRKRRR
jgi:hypothetical protein